MGVHLLFPLLINFFTSFSQPTSSWFSSGSCVSLDLIPSARLDGTACHAFIGWHASVLLLPNVFESGNSSRSLPDLRTGSWCVTKSTWCTLNLCRRRPGKCLPCASFPIRSLSVPKHPERLGSWTADCCSRARWHLLWNALDWWPKGVHVWRFQQSWVTACWWPEALGCSSSFVKSVGKCLGPVQLGLELLGEKNLPFQRLPVLRFPTTLKPSSVTAEGSMVEVHWTVVGPTACWWWGIPVRRSLPSDSSLRSPTGWLGSSRFLASPRPAGLPSSSWRSWTGECVDSPAPPLRWFSELRGLVGGSAWWVSDGCGSPGGWAMVALDTAKADCSTSCGVQHKSEMSMTKRPLVFSWRGNDFWRFFK